MVAPVTGPFTKVIASGRIWSKSKVGYRQKRPYNLVLPASMNDYFATEGWSTQTGSMVDIRDWSAGSFNRFTVDTYPSSGKQQAYNQAWSRLQGQLKGSEAGIGVNLVQRKQAMDMMQNRVLQIATFAKHLRKLELGAAANVLGLTQKRVRTLNIRKDAKAFGNNFLEFHFGWSPLVQDIGNTIDTLQGGVPPLHVSAKGSHSFSEGGPSPNGNEPPVQVASYTGSHSYTVKLGAVVKISNPNLFLANQLGLVNPAAVAWDSVPFSFVVDWFVNVSDFLNGFTDLWGLEILSSYNTSFVRSKGSWQVQKFVSSWGQGPYQAKHAAEWVTFKRGTGIGLGPTLKVRPLKAISPSRGLTAISLLLQHLR